VKIKLIHTNNHDKKTGRAILCPYGCGLFIKWKRDPVAGEGFYAEIGTWKKHRCDESRSQQTPMQGQSKRCPTQFHTAWELYQRQQTDLTQRVALETEFTDLLQRLIDFGNTYIWTSFKMRLEMEDGE
jgi:hypothetical protein